jgi:acyl-coenzyme A synthetase/AMP-(fatty) acid ligase
MTFPDAVFAALRAEPGRVVVEHDSRQVTNTELLDMTARIAGGMRARGVKQGTGIAMTTGVTPAALAAYLAGFALGARVVGIRPGFSQKQLDHIRGDGIDLFVDDAEVTSLLAAESEPLLITTRPNDVARLVYTSGSTGMPKGCAQTYRAMDSAWDWRIAAFAGRMDRYLLFGSLASVVAQDYLMLALLSGGVAVIPDVPKFPEVIEKYRITFTIMNVPRLYQMLDSLRDNPVDTSSLRGMLVTGSPLAPHRLAEAVSVLGPVVFQGYGQSEAGTLTLLSPDGFLYLTGRARDVIIVGGYPVYAGPIERVLATHPDVDQAYVVGTPDEEVHAFVIPLTGRDPDRAELSTLVNGELGPASVPATFTFVDSVPVAPSGKPDKKALLGE